ncbi:MAG: hypothetical protein K0V04_36830, partial [Deltaproteobacteria bacterium]|nr:hypothetical protein [Deltaproteobacteria bacterium]
MPYWSQATLAACLMAISACWTAPGGHKPPQDPNDRRLTVGSPESRPPTTASAPPARDLSTPYTPEERLALAHREDDRNATTPASTLRLTEALSHRPAARDTGQLSEQIAVLKRLIKATDSAAPEFADLLFRLGATYEGLRAHNESRAEGLTPQIDAALAAGDTHNASLLRQRQAKLHEQARTSLTDAVKIYQALVTKPQFEHYQHRDDALFQYGLGLSELDRAPEMRHAYLTIVRQFPSSPHVPFVYASFGDHYLRKGRLREAHKLYAKAIASGPDSPLVAYAMTKQAWCDLLQGREEDEG